jgi:hypothetical protein
MQLTRRLAALGFAAACARLARSQDQDDITPDRQPRFPRPDQDSNDRLPNGKSRSNAIAAEQHKKALSEADQLLKMAQDLRNEIAEAGQFVVPIGAVRKTDEIEKLAKHIRGRLQS